MSIYSAEGSRYAWQLIGGIAASESSGASGELRHQRHAARRRCPVLLIIFMVVTPVLQKGVPVNLPVTEDPEDAGHRQAAQISVKADGTVYLGSCR
jgi:hypothetical protein